MYELKLSMKIASTFWFNRDNTFVARLKLNIGETIDCYVRSVIISVDFGQERVVLLCLTVYTESSFESAWLITKWSLMCHSDPPSSTDRLYRWKIVLCQKTAINIHNLQFETYSYGWYNYLRFSSYPFLPLFPHKDIKKLHAFLE